MNHIVDDHDALVDYLYEEGDPARRLEIAQHLQQCAPCAVAVLEFQNVRSMLSDWAPPAARPIAARPASSGAAVSDQQTRIPYSRFGRFAQAAAALLIFAAGMAVSQLDLEFRDGRLVVSTPSALPAPGVREASITLRPDSPSMISAAPAPVNAPASISAAAAPRPEEIEHLLQRVRAMIDQSEQRQQRELALRLSQVAREVDAQHQVDIVKIQEDMGRQQDATIDYLVRTSGGVK
jgi:hypothetical protein